MGEVVLKVSLAGEEFEDLGWGPYWEGGLYVLGKLPPLPGLSELTYRARKLVLKPDCVGIPCEDLVSGYMGFIWGFRFNQGSI